MKAAMRKKPGPAPMYGVRAKRQYIYFPPELEQYINRDAAHRNMLAGDPTLFDFSSTVVDVLLRHYGLREKYPSRKK
jgi:hypothetical protein